MKKLLSFFLICGAALWHPAAKAQQQLSVQYVVAVPAAGFNGYIGETSFNGALFELHRHVGPVALGGSFGWNAFYERKPHGLYHDGNASFSGVQYHYANILPLHLGGYYTFFRERELNPVAGIGMGALYSMQVTDMGLYRWATDYWSLSVRPEAGLLYWPWFSTGIKVAFRYNQSFKTSASNPGQSFWTFSVGFVY